MIVAVAFMVCWICSVVIGLWAAWSFLDLWAALLITFSVAAFHLYVLGEVLYSDE